MCGSSSNLHLLGTYDTVTECALECKKTDTCKYFAYGRWKGRGVGESGHCKWDKTSTPECPQGFVQNANYDLYALRGNINQI